MSTRRRNVEVRSTIRYQLEPGSMREARDEFERIRASQCPSESQVQSLTNLITWSAGVMYGDGVQPHLRRRAAELHVELREYLAEVTCAAGGRNQNPSVDWKLAPKAEGPHVRVDGHFEIYRSPVTKAMLRLTNSDPNLSEHEIQERVSDGDSAWAVNVYDPWNGFWYAVEEDTDEDETFKTREAALEAASEIERDIASAKVLKGVRWQRDDVPAYLAWFQKQSPNRVDYVRILVSNDHNGSYMTLLRSPLEDAEETFRTAFEDDLRATNPAKSMINRADVVAFVEKKREQKWGRKTGGLADGKTAADFETSALVDGLIVELEHTSDWDTAMRIAMDHLVEDRNYYCKLEFLESSSRRHQSSNPRTRRHDMIARRVARGGR
jgi:hypothetical protein